MRKMKNRELIETFTAIINFTIRVARVSHKQAPLAQLQEVHRNRKLRSHQIKIHYKASSRRSEKFTIEVYFIIANNKLEASHS